MDGTAPVLVVRPVLRGPACRCEDFAYAALALGFDVAFAASPAALAALGARHVYTCVGCGLVAGLV